MVRYPQFLNDKGFTQKSDPPPPTDHHLAPCPKDPSSTSTGSRPSLTPGFPKRFYCWKASSSHRLRPLAQLPTSPHVSEKGSFTQILTPRGEKGRTEPTNPTGSHPSLKPLGSATTGSIFGFVTFPPLLSGIPSFSITNVFPGY